MLHILYKDMFFELSHTKLSFNQIDFLQTLIRPHLTLMMCNTLILIPNSQSLKNSNLPDMEINTDKTSLLLIETLLAMRGKTLLLLTVLLTDLEVVFLGQTGSTKNTKGTRMDFSSRDLLLA